MRRSVLTLVLLAFVTFFLGLGRQAVSDSDEAFYAEAAREMVESGDWLTPYFNYDQRWQKPILYYWLTAATYLPTGPTEWAARIWAALSGLGLVLLTWAIARRSTDAATAWLAGAIVATCYGYFAMARLALPDLPLAFFITLGIWAALERWWVVAGLAAALGFLMKGPVALAVPAIVLLPIWWREPLTRPKLRDVAIAAATFLVVGTPWYASMTLEHGTAYLQSFFLSDNLERFATDRFNEPRPIWFYLPILMGGLLPWSIYLLVVPWRSVVDFVRGRQRLSNDEWRLILWAGLPVLFFTISIGKQPRYILPVLPPLAILLARAIAGRIDAASGFPGRRSAEHEGGSPMEDSDVASGFSRKERGLAVATWLTAALYVALALLLYRARPLFVTTAYPWMTTVAVGAIAVGAAAIAWLAVSRQWRRLPTILAASSAALLLAVQFGALAGLRPEPVEQMAALVRANRTAGEPVGEYQVFVRNLVFYLGFKQVELFDEARAIEFLQSPERVLLVVRAGDIARLQSIAGVTTRRLGEVLYLNAANIRIGPLLSPIPEQDLETVLLVTNK